MLRQPYSAKLKNALSILYHKCGIICYVNRVDKKVYNIEVNFEIKKSVTSVGKCITYIKRLTNETLKQKEGNSKSNEGSA